MPFPPPGYSINDLVHTAKACKKIFDAFFDEYRNAPARLRELGQLVATYYRLLEDNERILKNNQAPFPGHEGLKATLEEWTAFLGKYTSVNDPGSNKAKKVYYTGRWGLDGEKVEELDHQLMRHAMPMLLWNSISMMKWNVEQKETAIIPPHRFRLSESTAPQLGVSATDHEDLRQAEIARRELDRFQMEMSGLQRKMAQQQAETPRPLNRHVWRATFFRECHDIVSRHLSNMGLPADELLDIFAISDALEDDITPSEDFRFTDIKRCSVTASIELSIIPESHLLDLSGYQVGEDQKKKIRVVIWYDKHERQILRHHIPVGTQPYTRHSNYTSDQNTIRFLQHQTLHIHGARHYMDPEYAFSNSLDCESFQRFVRNRELRGTFDVDEIKCSSGLLAEVQHIKVWRLHGADDRPTVSFFADRLDREDRDNDSAPPTYCEFPLRYFESIAANPRQKVLKLRLNKEVVEQRRRQPSISSIFSRRRSSAQASPTSPRSSLSRDRLPGLLYDSKEHDPIFTEDNRYEEMKYLEIKFSDSADIETFVRTSYSAHPENSLKDQSQIHTDIDKPPPSTQPIPIRVHQSSSDNQRLTPPITMLRPGSMTHSSFHDPYLTPRDLQPQAAPADNSQPLPIPYHFQPADKSQRSDSLFKLPEPAIPLPNPSPSISIPSTPGLTERSFPTSTNQSTPNTIVSAPSLLPLKLPQSSWPPEFDDWAKFEKHHE